MKRARSDVPGSSFRYEIDATTEDVYLLFPYQLKERLSSGRPTVYRVVDVDSGMIVGLHVGIGGPNWRGVMQALYNAFTDKVEFCLRYGIEISPEEWPCHHVCTELTIDNGVEYPRVNMARILDEGLGIDCINYTQIYAGDRKGTVEGEFSHNRNDVIQFMPGVVDKIPEKGSVHASNLAVFSYDKFMQLLIVNTLKRNNFIPKPRVEDKEMAEAGQMPTSLTRWNFSMRHYMNGGRGRVHKAQDVMFKLLPTSKASTTSRGIKYRGVYYTCNYAAQKGWLNDNPQRPVKKLSIRYFDGSSDQIWYEHGGQIHTASINLEQSHAYNGVTWFDISHKQTLDRQRNKVMARQLREVEIAQKNHANQLKKEAYQDLKGTKQRKAKSVQPTLHALQEIMKNAVDKNTANLINGLLGTELRNKQETIVVSAKQQAHSRQFDRMYAKPQE